MIEEISGAMCVVDTGGQVLWANSEFDRWFSAAGQKAVGKNIESLFPGLYGECPKGVVISHIDRRGLKHFLEARCDTFFNEAGREISSLITLKDVTLLQVLLNISVLTMSTTTPEALLDEAVGAISDTFGYRTIAAMLHKDGYLELAVSRGYSPKLQSLLSRQKVAPEERGLAGKSAYTSTIITKEIKAGTVSEKLLEESRRLDIHWATTIPLTDRAGLLGVLAFSTSEPPDIDEIDLLKTVCNQITLCLRKILTEEALSSARNELELYVDLMCHDITNAIQISLGYLELIDRGTESPDHGYISCSTNSLQKINRLIETVRGLRSVSRVELADISLKEAVENAITALACNPCVGGKEINFDISNIEAVTVKANELLKDVLYNLLEAVCRHLRDRGRVKLVSERFDGQCRLIIEDEGPGSIDLLHEYLIKGRLAEKTTEVPTIGMYFVYNIINSYGGSITISERVPGDLEAGNRIVIVMKTGEPV